VVRRRGGTVLRRLRFRAVTFGAAPRSAARVELRAVAIGVDRLGGRVDGSPHSATHPPWLEGVSYGMPATALIDSRPARATGGAASRQAPCRTRSTLMVTLTPSPWLRSVVS